MTFPTKIEGPPLQTEFSPSLPGAIRAFSPPPFRKDPRTHLPLTSRMKREEPNFETVGLSDPASSSLPRGFHSLFPFQGGALDRKTLLGLFFSPTTTGVLFFFSSIDGGVLCRSFERQHQRALFLISGPLPQLCIFPFIEMNHGPSCVEVATQMIPSFFGFLGRA